jgi:16S rRNA C967 or C1407 C5-methylase (RsmB/RsmF family)
VYRDWLDSVTRQVSAELANIWKGRSEVTDRWFDSTCAPAIKKALAVLVKQRIVQARDVETKRLERLSSKTRTGIRNPIATAVATEIHGEGEVGMPQTGLVPCFDTTS